MELQYSVKYSLAGVSQRNGGVFLTTCFTSALVFFMLAQVFM